jgi:hypothetical protein
MALVCYPDFPEARTGINHDVASHPLAGKACTAGPEIQCASGSADGVKDPRNAEGVMRGYHLLGYEEIVRGIMRSGISVKGSGGDGNVRSEQGHIQIRPGLGHKGLL